MPRMPAVRKPAVESRSASKRTLAVIAIERLAKLAVQGAASHKLSATLRDIIAGWRAGGVEPAELRDEIEALLADLDLGMEAAENWVTEAETDGQRKAAQAQFDGLRATRDAVLSELG